MFDLCRRGFLKLATTMIGGITVAQYVQPEMSLPELHPWVTDMGDFYYVRIPDFKTFRGETLDKPCVFLAGERSTACDLKIRGYVDLHFPRHMTFKDNEVDVSEFLIEGRNNPVELFGANSGGVITRNTYVVGPAYG